MKKAPEEPHAHSRLTATTIMLCDYAVISAELSSAKTRRTSLPQNTGHSISLKVTCVFETQSG